MIFLVLSRKMVFSPKNMILFFRWKMKDDLSQKIHGNIFSVYSVKMVLKEDTLKDNISSIIEKDDIHPRKNYKKVFFYKKVPIILCTFMETFIGLKFEFWIRLKIELKLDLFKLYAWRHSTMKNIQYSIPFSPQELCLGVYFSVNQGNLLSIRRWVAILKIKHMWRRWDTPQNFFFAFIDGLEKQIIIKKLLKWAK